MNMYGWDTAFVVSLAHVNRALAQNTAQLIQDFSAQIESSEVRCTFGTWSLVADRTGKLVTLRIAIRSGYVRISPTAEAIDLAHHAIELAISLQLLPAPDGADGTHLVINYQDLENLDAAQNGAVSPHRVYLADGSRMSRFQEAVLGGLVSKGLARQAGKISFVFAMVNPGAVAGVPWLTPVSSDYHLVQEIGESAPVLTIFSMVTARSSPSYQPNVDPGLLSGSGDAGCAISGQLFLQHMVGPTLASHFGANPNIVTMEADGSVSLNGEFYLQSVPTTWYTFYPKVYRVTAAVQDTRITITCSGGCDMLLGASMNFTHTAMVTVGIDPETKTLRFTLEGTPVIDQEKHVPWYASVVSSAYENLCKALAVCVDWDIDMVLGNDFLRQAPSLVTWTGGTGFSPTDATLADAFVVRGKLD